MYESIERVFPKKGRRNVKTGCKTCKLRRLKCDESRPACRRCLSTRRVCDGYGIWGGGGTPYGQPQSNRGLSTYCTPVPVGSLTPDEQVSFDWFMEMTTKKFAGLFPSDFWEKLIFQASAQEPAVRHAVVALSAAHRFDHYYEPWKIPATYGFDAERFTLQQYNKAIQHLSVALITCMIFVTLEYLRGQHQRGSAHLRHGIHILSNISDKKSSMTPNIFKPAEDFAHDALIDSYARLSIQSAMFGHVPANMCAVFRDPKTNALPYSFDSVSEARQTLDDLLNRNHCLKRHSDTVREKEIKGDRREVANTQKAILEDLTLWRKAFDNSLPRFVNKGRSGKFGHQLLVVNFEMAMIMAATCLSKDEMIFDQYTERILTIVTTFVNMWNFFATLDIKIKDLRKTLDDPTQACAGNGFTAECGFIPPIYYTTLKCRDPRIRRQSIVIVILRSVPHREGVWNGLLLADVAEQVMWMEEDGVYDGDPTVDDRIAVQDPPARDLPLPEIKRSMRVSDVGVVLADMVDGHTFVTYKKLQGGHWKHFSRVLQPCWLSKGSPSGSFSSTGLPLSPAS